MFQCQASAISLRYVFLKKPSSWKLYCSGPSNLKNKKQHNMSQRCAKWFPHCTVMSISSELSLSVFPTLWFHHQRFYSIRYNSERSPVFTYPWIDLCSFKSTFHHASEKLQTVFQLSTEDNKAYSFYFSVWATVSCFWCGSQLFQTA